ncbi:MAG TPA: VTT domain-containing protein [Burkholderiales bacterium]|nr:VTT domain-containing protein [Burkholderiales bacterium]
MEARLHATQPGRGAKKRRPAWARIAALVIVVGALAAAWRYTPLSEYLTHERIAGWARDARDTPWTPVAILLAYTPAAFVMFPRPLITLFAVIAYGPWLGFAYGMAGILTSAIAAYYAGRALPRDTAMRFAGDKVEPVTKVLRAHGVAAVFAMRIVPIAPHAVESVLAGTMRIKVWQFAVGTFAGMFPGVLTTAVFGGEIATALEDASRINYWLVGGVLALFAAMTWYVRWWFKRRQAS